MSIKVLSVAIAVAGLVLAGCSKQEPTPSPETGSKAAGTATTDRSKTVEAAKAAGEKAVADVAQQVQETTAAANAKAQGLIDKAKNLIAFYATQQRNVLRNVGRIDPMDIRDYFVHGGYAALAKALTSMAPDEVIDEVESSGLRGWGGGGSPRVANGGRASTRPGTSAISSVTPTKAIRGPSWTKASSKATRTR